jgi:hypothetical protein
MSMIFTKCNFAKFRIHCFPKGGNGGAELSGAQLRHEEVPVRKDGVGVHVSARVRAGTDFTKLLFGQTKFG